ncbi:MAG: dihydrofolate reductase [Pyrinomonadaceae bacterium]|nr:dihydrofolate reductase [Pyrinomonadaceae bacterium]MCX7640458.1 dihydrofolate reductase [Pyrinomonadaceae bacterium]
MPSKAIIENVQEIIGVVAIAKNLAIGKNGQLPWHCESDLKFFRKLTTGHTVVMGYKTWLSIGKPLKNRLNIVLSRSHILNNQPNLLLMRSKEEVLAIRRYLNCDIFIIGGAKVYSTFSREIQRWFVTEIPLEIENADTFMLENFLEDFDQINTINLQNEVTVRVYERRKPLSEPNLTASL